MYKKEKGEFSDIKFFEKRSDERNFFLSVCFAGEKKYRKIFLIKEKQGRFFKKFTTENFLKNTLALE